MSYHLHQMPLLLLLLLLREVLGVGVRLALCHAVFGRRNILCRQGERGGGPAEHCGHIGSG